MCSAVSLLIICRGCEGPVRTPSGVTRDTFVLLLRFIATQKHRSVPELDVDHVGQEVLDFLHDLEVERHNLAATRNVRLAAIHAFFRYCAAEHPERIEHCQRIWPCRSSARALVWLST